MIDKYSILIVEDDYDTTQGLYNLFHCHYQVTVSKSGGGMRFDFWKRNFTI